MMPERGDYFRKNKKAPCRGAVARSEGGSAAENGNGNMHMAEWNRDAFSRGPSLKSFSD